jgi:hypothetical protein
MTVREFQEADGRTTYMVDYIIAEGIKWYRAEQLIEVLKRQKDMDQIAGLIMAMENPNNKNIGNA